MFGRGFESLRLHENGIKHN